MPLTHRGFSTWIESQGKILPEYLVAIDETAHRVSCWIPSEEGQTFTVYWTDLGGNVDTCAFIMLDGILVPGRFLYGSGTTCRGAMRTGLNTERPFVFQRIPETAGRVGSTAQGVNKDLGMITLRIKQVTRLGERSANAVQQVPAPRTDHRPIGDIRIGFGDERRGFEQHAQTWSVAAPGTQGGQPRTFVTFVFRYRTLEFLASQGIISEPRNFSPARASTRRVVSAPFPSFPSPLPTSSPVSLPPPSPSPSPSVHSTASSSRSHDKDKRKQKEKPYLPVESHDPRRRNPAQTRRAVTWQPSADPRAHPGEGVMMYNPSHLREEEEEEEYKDHEPRGK